VLKEAIKEQYKAKEVRTRRWTIKEHKIEHYAEI
jgi:hypothetical protein